jgi:hypothetical protein
LLIRFEDYKMKKFVVLFASIYLVASSAASAFVLSAAAIAAVSEGAVTGLMPILEPLAKRLIGTAANEIEAIVLGNRCPERCVNTLFGCKKGPLTGKSPWASFCKKTCTKLKIVGGYELRVRFGKEEDGKKWDLTKCLKDAVASGYQEMEGKSVGSIAIYSQEDLDDVLSLIALKMAAEHIIQTIPPTQKALTQKQKEEFGAEKTVEEVRKEAEDVVKHIEAEITKNVKVPENAPKGKMPKYGYQ